MSEQKFKACREVNISNTQVRIKAFDVPNNITTLLNNVETNLTDCGVDIEAHDPESEKTNTLTLAVEKDTGLIHVYASFAPTSFRLAKDKINNFLTAVNAMVSTDKLGKESLSVVTAVNLNAILHQHVIKQF